MRSSLDSPSRGVAPVVSAQVTKSSAKLFRVLYWKYNYDEIIFWKIFSLYRQVLKGWYYENSREFILITIK